MNKLGIFGDRMEPIGTSKILGKVVRNCPTVTVSSFDLSKCFEVGFMTIIDSSSFPVFWLNCTSEISKMVSMKPLRAI